MPYPYSSFDELAAEKQVGVHYRIRHAARKSSVLVMAPHGGRIERHTSEIAENIAGEQLSFYAFEGLQQRDNYRHLHISSHLFDEPTALRLAQASSIVLTVHGHKSTDEKFLMMGGLHQELCEVIHAVAEDCGFLIREPTPPLSGRHPDNVCNRGQLGAGVQLEFSRALRDALTGDPSEKFRFADATRSALLDLPGVDSS